MFARFLGQAPEGRKTAALTLTAERHAVTGASLQAPPGEGEEEVLFGCGCFWGAEKGFWRLPGVVSTAVGYAGGSVSNPNYNEVCGGLTGHAEVVRVVWRSNAVDFSDLLKLFWECHDPTQGDRQGNDRGSQYRSAIFTFSPRQKELALASRGAYQELLAEKGFGSITTEIASEKTFYFAEAYHQQYLVKPGSRSYCSAQPSGLKLAGFPGAEYKLPAAVWDHFDWSVSHCVLRGDNAPIRL